MRLTKKKALLLTHDLVSGLLFLLMTSAVQVVSAGNNELQTLTFENGVTGQVPSSFSTALTGKGRAGRWEIESIENALSGNKVISQLDNDRTNARYPLLVYKDFSAKDVDIAVSFKTISGKRDASGGIVFRYQDSKNYYVVRANSLEDNIVAYKTQNGKRSNIGVLGKKLSYGVKTPVKHQEWQKLQVVAVGSLFKVFLNGEMVFEVENDTFESAGKVGLWTKADAVTQFDNLSIKSLD